MKIGEWLKLYRQKHNLSMQELANACGFSKAYIGMLEKGINPTTNKPVSPTLQALDKIAYGTGYDIDTLFKMLDSDQPVTANSLKALDNEETELVNIYRELNADDKSFLWNVMNRLVRRSDFNANVQIG